MNPVYSLDYETLYLDPRAAAEIGKGYAAQYQSGEPYHYICLDNFLPMEVAQRVREEALALDLREAEHVSAQEHLKASYNPDTLPLFSRSVFGALNSEAFLRFLEEMTGIPNLIPDPYYKGGGIHRTGNGGYLGIHADFNHHKQMNLERRVNLLIYLNPDWQDTYGGAFEVWTNDMKTQVAAFPPFMNRMCAFSTSSTSYHGNPEPVNHPNGDPRLSIALYYYSPTWGPGKVSHSTLFRIRPDSGDKPTQTAGRDLFVQKVTPPFMYPLVRKVMNKVGI